MNISWHYRRNGQRPLGFDPLNVSGGQMQVWCEGGPSAVGVVMFVVGPSGSMPQLGVVQHQCLS